MGLAKCSADGVGIILALMGLDGDDSQVLNSEFHILAGFLTLPAMSKVTTVEPPVKAKPSVDMEVLASLHPELMDDSYVYVHCHFNNRWQDMLIRSGDPCR